MVRLPLELTRPIYTVYHLYHSYATDSTDQKEVATAFPETAHLSWVPWEPISPRLARLSPRKHVHNFAVVPVYGPTREKDDVTKNAFYMDVQSEN